MRERERSQKKEFNLILQNILKIKKQPLVMLERSSTDLFPVYNTYSRKVRAYIKKTLIKPSSHANTSFFLNPSFIIQ